MRTIELSLDGGRKCPISVGHDILDQLGAACTELELGKRVAIIADSAVTGTHLTPVTASLRRAGFDVIDIAFSGGDAAKSLRSAEAIYGRLIEAELDRGSWIAATPESRTRVTSARSTCPTLLMTGSPLSRAH